MKPLIITNTCRRDQEGGRHSGIEDTWLREWSDLIDHRFVYGVKGCRDPGAGDLIITEDKFDSYTSEPLRLIGACQYAIENRYDHIFKTDVDTYIIAPRLLAAFPPNEYQGVRCIREVYASGGAGFWLGPRAIRVLADQKATAAPYGDKWVGETLAANKIMLRDDRRFVAVDQKGPPFHYEDPRIWDTYGGVISVHLGRGTGNYKSEWMRECHRGYLESRI